MSLGRDDVLEKVIRISGADRMAFLRSAADRGMAEIAALKGPDGGRALRNAESYVVTAGELCRSAMERARELTAGKPALDRYLTDTISALAKAAAEHRARVAAHYRSVAALKGFRPEAAKPAAEEARMRELVPSKTAFLRLSDRTPYAKISGAMSKDQALQMDIFRKYSYQYFMQLYAVADGKRTLSEIRDLLGLEFKPVEPADLMRHVKALEDAGLIKLSPRKAG